MEKKTFGNITVLQRNYFYYVTRKVGNETYHKAVGDLLFKKKKSSMQSVWFVVVKLIQTVFMLLENTDLFIVILELTVT